MSGIQISKAEIEECQKKQYSKPFKENGATNDFSSKPVDILLKADFPLHFKEIVNNFRVNELHLLLTSYHYPKLGKKQDLVQRAKSILSNPKYQLSAVQKVREIQASNRIRGIVPPYPNSSSTAQTSQTDLAMRRQQFLQNQNAMNRCTSNPSLLQATGNFGSHFSNSTHSAGSNSFAGVFNHFTQPSNQGSSSMFSNFGYSSLGNGGSSGQVRNLKVVALPFYDVKSVLVPLTELPSFNVQPRPGEARHQCLFGVTPESSSRLFYKSEEQPLPRFEIQLRMFQLDTASEQQDAFPPGCLVKLDDYNVTLPNIIPTNKPNAEHKRLSRPVNLTPYCQPPRPRDRPHRIVIEWNGDKRTWAFSISIVLRLNSNILQDRILQNGTARRSFENTKSVVIKRLNGDDDDGIEMESLKVSLLCPLMRTRIKIPARAVDCTHLQFFDLTNYLMMCEKRPVWKCPVCDNLALYSKLIIDQYFQKVITETCSSVEEVELLRDGTWRVIKEEVMDLSDDDDDVRVASSFKGVSKPSASHSSAANSSNGTSTVSNSKDKTPATSTAANKNNDDCEIITLSDSDDDLSPRTAVRQTSVSSTTTPIPTTSGEGDAGSNPNSNSSSVNGGDLTTNKSNSNCKTKITPSRSNSSSICESNDEKRLSDSGQTNATNNNNNNNNTKERDTANNDAGDDDMDSSDSIICLDSDDGNEGNDTVREESREPTNVDKVVNGNVHNFNSGILPTKNATHQSSEITGNNTQNLSYNGAPALQTNGFNSFSFRPVIDEVAKNQVAQELAAFLQSVCAKNSMTNSA